MQRFLALIMALILSVSVLAGCGNKEKDTEKADQGAIQSLKTMGDLASLEREEEQSSVGNGKAVFAFKYGGTYYRVTADLTEETEKEYIDVDILEEGYEEKQREILAPVEITKIEDLSEQILPQEDLDALAGKTGKELVDEGWTYSGSYNLEEMQVWMVNGPFEYTVVFDGNIDEENSDDFDIEKATKDMKVKSAEFNALGDAANVE